MLQKALRLLWGLPLIAFLFIGYGFWQTLSIDPESLKSRILRCHSQHDEPCELNTLDQLSRQDSPQATRTLATLGVYTLSETGSSSYHCALYSRAESIRPMLIYAMTRDPSECEQRYPEDHHVLCLTPSSRQLELQYLLQDFKQGLQCSNHGGAGNGLGIQ